LPFQIAYGCIFRYDLVYCVESHDSGRWKLRERRRLENLRYSRLESLRYLESIVL